jgi:hypothetical protein
MTVHNGLASSTGDFDCEIARFWVNTPNREFRPNACTNPLRFSAFSARDGTLSGRSDRDQVLRVSSQVQNGVQKLSDSLGQKYGKTLAPSPFELTLQASLPVTWATATITGRASPFRASRPLRMTEDLKDYWQPTGLSGLRRPTAAASKRNHELSTKKLSGTHPAPADFAEEAEIPELTRDRWSNESSQRRR